MNQRSIEIRVGALILVAVALIAVFTVLMAGITFQPTYTVYVSFQNPGGLTTGAPVRISGVKVGRVSDIEFLGALGQKPPAGQSDALIRVTAKLETRYANAIHDNSRWFVTVQGVLGEMFLAVDPGSPTTSKKSPKPSTDSIARSRSRAASSNATRTSSTTSSRTPTSSRPRPWTRSRRPARATWTARK
jgi:ABC-type transporter Mla subunit MlaD